MRHEDELRALWEAEHASLVRTAFLISGSSTTAEDLVAEAFARAATRWRRLRRYDRPGAWLRLVVVRLAVRERERAEREPSGAPVPEAVHLDPPPPDPALLAALQELTPSQRDCIVLHHIEDLPVDRIAQSLGMPAGTVRSHLHRGRTRLAALLGENSETAMKGASDA